MPISTYNGWVTVANATRELYRNPLPSEVPALRPDSLTSMLVTEASVADEADAHGDLWL